MLFGHSWAEEALCFILPIYRLYLFQKTIMPSDLTQLAQRDR